MYDHLDREFIQKYILMCILSYGFSLGDFFSGGDHHSIIDGKGEILNLIPETLRRHMYLHQLNGFQFLWKNIGGATLIEGIKTPLPEGSSGCIISHAPVPGKTYLTIKKLLERISENVFEKVHLVSLISAHPSLVAEHEVFSDHKSMLEELKISPEAGVKTQFVIELVRLSKAPGEKVLIFSEYIDPLNFLMKQLASHFSWEEGKQVLYMDGKLDEKQRQVVIHSLKPVVRG
ncbi:hypothetical protein M9H77_09405 [Catharanthus roseus]|uniref:Uncharacterized protein n=1 Tax=Catharanthus roseus TaxID=4058 RepID=A0ACC0C0K3_CATRO|nr:hypothetical protein M9H77_09405 [Catharanthus roseus]